MLNKGDKVILTGYYNSSNGVTTTTVEAVNVNTIKLENGYTIYRESSEGRHPLFRNQYGNKRLKCDVRKGDFNYYPIEVYEYSQEKYDELVKKIEAEIFNENELKRKKEEREVARTEYDTMVKKAEVELELKKEEVWLRTMCSTCKFNINGRCIKVFERKFTPIQEAWRWSSCSWEKKVE